MAYDRYDTRDRPRGDRSRWSEDRDRERFSDRDWDRDRERGFSEREERGFFERAGDEIASWFGDDDADRRRDQDRFRDEREGRYDRDYAAAGREREPSFRGRDEGRGRFFGRDRGVDRDRERDFGRERGYRPMTGDYGRESGQFFAASGAGRGPRGMGDEERSPRSWSRDERGERSRDVDPHYRSWRDRHLSELDRDYDEYRRENQSRFENDFTSWRETRQQKRSLLGQIREHMEVVGNDDERVGTVDRVAGDRIILAKSDPESGGAHHSLSCSEIDRVEGDRVILNCSATEARVRWRDESRSRALFEREDQGEMGPRILDRSFEGTYR